MVISPWRPLAAQPPAKPAQPQNTSQATPVKPAMPQSSPAANPASPAPSNSVVPASTTASPAAAPVTSAPLPSAMLKPSLSRVRDTLSNLHLEKWKRGSVRDEAADDIGSILGELETNIPQLLSDADAAPETLSKLLPASRHVNALYETFLRVYDTARIAGPPEQITQIQVSAERPEQRPPRAR